MRRTLNSLHAGTLSITVHQTHPSGTLKFRWANRLPWLSAACVHVITRTAGCWWKHDGKISNVLELNSSLRTTMSFARARSWSSAVHPMSSPRDPAHSPRTDGGRRYRWAWLSLCNNGTTNDLSLFHFILSQLS